MKKTLPGSLKELFQKAQKARKNSYSPYSGYSVGAAVRLESGEVFSGCNVENSSFGATVCAERVAIHSAVAENGKIEISEVMVLTDSPTPWPPCGICRQVIAEFAGSGPDAVKIYLVNLQEKMSSHTLKELLPLAFDPSHLRT